MLAPLAVCIREDSPCRCAEESAATSRISITRIDKWEMRRGQGASSLILQGQNAWLPWARAAASDIGVRPDRGLGPANSGEGSLEVRC